MCAGRFGHIAISVDDVQAECDRLEKLGVEFKKRPQDGKMKHIAFIYDPDRYWCVRASVTSGLSARILTCSRSTGSRLCPTVARRARRACELPGVDSRLLNKCVYAVGSESECRPGERRCSIEAAVLSVRAISTPAPAPEWKSGCGVPWFPASPDTVPRVQYHGSACLRGSP